MHACMQVHMYLIDASLYLHTCLCIYLVIYLTIYLPTFLRMWVSMSIAPRNVRYVWTYVYIWDERGSHVQACLMYTDSESER